MVEKNKVYNSKCKSIRKCENKMIEILTKLKSRNLFKFRSNNLSKSKKV